jgi:hypothetical protein
MSNNEYLALIGALSIFLDPELLNGIGRRRPILWSLPALSAQAGTNFRGF